MLCRCVEGELIERASLIKLIWESRGIELCLQVSTTKEREKEKEDGKKREKLGRRSDDRVVHLVVSRHRPLVNGRCESGSFLHLEGEGGVAHCGVDCWPGYEQRIPASSVKSTNYRE